MQSRKIIIWLRAPSPIHRAIHLSSWDLDIAHSSRENHQNPRWVDAHLSCRERVNSSLRYALGGRSGYSWVAIMDAACLWLTTDSLLLGISSPFGSPDFNSIRSCPDFRSPEHKRYKTGMRPRDPRAYCRSHKRQDWFGTNRTQSSWVCNDAIPVRERTDELDGNYGIESAWLWLGTS